MKKLLLFLAVVLFPLCTPLSTIRAEEITSFDAAITINKNGSFDVLENILYDFGPLEKHGIFRTLPFEKTNTEGKRFRMDLASFSVSNDQDQPYNVSKTNQGSNIELKIGDANVLLTGQKEYRIHYTVSGGLTYFSDHDELYWQVTGTDWQVPIQKATAVVSFPESIDQTAIRLACYTGTSGSSTADCETRYENGTVIITSNHSLSPGEGLTLVVGFPKNIVAVLEPTPVNTWLSDLIENIVIIFIILGSIAWYLILPIWIVVHWYRVGRDPKPPMGVTSAWFDVPKTDSHRPLTPGETGTLIDEKAEMREMTGTIVDLARRGYLKIIEKKKNDFYLEKRNDQQKGDTLEAFEQTLYDGIFEEDELVRIKDADLIETISQTKKELYDAVVKEQFFVSNPETVRTKYTIIGSIALFTVNFPLVLAAFIFGRAMPRKTMNGAQNAAIAQSLKNFITSQDRQYKYQAKNQIFFEKFLPYAIVFGVEKIWAQRFKDIALKKPDWYEGYDSMRTFNSVYFISSLNSSMNSVVSAATPTSSSSGFSSGFSGGSVGGGGGGGGGGSW